MKKNLFLVLSFFFSAAFVLASCKISPEGTQVSSPSEASSQSAVIEAISDEPISFVFVQSESSNFNSLYHQLSYMQMENAGYNVTNIYIDENTDLEYVYDGFAADGVKYAIVTSASLEDITQNYVLNSKPPVTFIQSSDYILSGLYSYQVKLYEYYYLCGVALAEASETMTAGFVADSPDEQSVSCINAFALGMKSVDATARVIVSWTDANAEKATVTQAEQSLLEQNCDVLAFYTQTDTAETSAEELEVYHMTMSTHKMLTDYKYLLIKPGINLTNYFASLINSSTSAPAYAFTYAGIKNNAISYELTNNAADSIRSAVLAAYQSIQNGYEVFSGPLYNDIGLIVPEGVSLPEEDILDMLWFVDNVIGQVPAG